MALMSAAMLGCYDSLKKHALKGNAVIPILFLNTLFSSLIFLPFIVLSGTTDILDDSLFFTASGGWEMHKYIVLKAVIVLSSWILGYFGMKHLPLTIVGPINATRPVMVLVGALLFFGERLNVWQWIGVMLAIASSSSAAWSSSRWLRAMSSSLFCCRLRNETRSLLLPTYSKARFFMYGLPWQVSSSSSLYPIANS